MKRTLVRLGLLGLLGALAAAGCGPASATGSAPGATGTPSPPPTPAHETVAGPIGEFRYEVAATASATYPIPGLRLTFAAVAGAASYLEAVDLAAVPVTPLGPDDNIGHTFFGTCRDAATDRPVAGGGAYFAENLVPAEEASISPHLGWLFVAPATATYVCAISVAAYSTVVGRTHPTVAMRIEPGATLVREPADAGASWTLPGKPGAVTLAPGTGETLLSGTYEPAAASATYLSAEAAAALTSCSPGAAPCAQGTAAVDGSTAKVRIEAQPVDAGGAACGAVLTGPSVERYISDARHHLTVSAELRLAKLALPSGCAALRIALLVEAVSGNPVYVAAGTPQGAAATLLSVREDSPAVETWAFTEASRFGAAAFAADGSAPGGSGTVATLTSQRGVATASSARVAVTPGTLLAANGDWRLAGHGTELELCFDAGGCVSRTTLGDLAGTAERQLPWTPFEVAAVVPPGASAAYLTWTVGSSASIDAVDWVSLRLGQ